MQILMAAAQDTNYQKDCEIDIRDVPDIGGLLIKDNLTFSIELHKMIKRHEVVHPPYGLQGHQFRDFAESTDGLFLSYLTSPV